MIRKVKNYLHKVEAYGAGAYYRFPSKGMTIIGVTGTDGKTTTASLIYHLLKSSGQKVAMITTIGAVIDGNVYDTGFHVTTPSPFLIQKYLTQARLKNCKYVVLEVTSHGLDQNRTAGVHFDVGVLTNITHEHLDYHKTISAYRQAKLKLFKRASKCIINFDDDSYNEFIKNLDSKKVITYSLNKKADYTPDEITKETNLIGDFNISNTLAAIAAVESCSDITKSQIAQALKNFEGPIGRQEIVYKKNCTIMIDFAHTPNSIEKILSNIRKDAKKRLIHVFGGAGKRDYFKRPLMGKASSKYADIIILTAEDPRNESIEKISNEISVGIDDDFIRASKEEKLQNNKTIYMISDRQEAIDFAVKIAAIGDYILITGKGHEKSMNYGHGEENWNEFEAVEHALTLKKWS